jgi:hypothetical protein
MHVGFEVYNLYKSYYFIKYKSIKILVSLSTKVWFYIGVCTSGQIYTSMFYIMSFYCNLSTEIIIFFKVYEISVLCKKV